MAPAVNPFPEDPPGQAPEPIGLPEAFRPKTGSMESWNAAYVRVEDYLRAHRIHNRLHQGRIIQKILERASKRHENHPALNPTTLAAEETEAALDAWFGEILDEKDQPADRLAVDGRVALLLCDGPERWPYAFLNRENSPGDFLKAMQSSIFEAGPDLAVSSMVPRPIDLGPITEAAGETLEKFDRWPFLVPLVLWLFFVTALGGIFYISR